MKLLNLFMMAAMYFCRYSAGFLWKHLESPEAALAFLMEYNVIRKTGTCRHCDVTFPPPHHRDDTNYSYFKCPKCYRKESIFKHSYLSQKNITPRCFVLFAYHFCMSEVSFWNISLSLYC